MDNGLLIKGARVLSYPEGLRGEMDILISDGVVQKVEPDIQAGRVEVVDAAGCVAAPGFIDMHTHLREPGMEYKEDVGSGSRAAAVGGFSAVFCMPNTEPAIDNSSVAEYVYDRGVDEGYCMVLPHGAITQGRRGEVLAPMGEMGKCRAGVRGFSDDGSPLVDSEIMRRAMEYARTMGATIISHSEEKSLSEGGQMNEGYYSTVLGLRGIPPESEQIGVYRDVCLAEKTGARLHLAHISTSGSVELVRWAKKRGLPVTCEVTPHHFSLDESMLTAYDTNMKMNPPLRSREDIDALLEGLADGTIDVIATDHAPHAPHEKETEFDLAEFGVIGLETCLAIVVTKLIEAQVLSLEEALRRMTVMPARIMEMERWGYSPTIGEGLPANLVVFDPDEEWKVDSSRFRSRARNTPYAGWKVKGRVRHTIFRGRLVVSNGELLKGPESDEPAHKHAPGNSEKKKSGRKARAAAASGS